MLNVKLKRLKIEKYWDVEPGTELCFNDTFNVLLGKNGTGKTTLLRLIAMVMVGDFATLKGTEFAFEYELTYSTINLKVRFENRKSEDVLGRIHELQLPRTVTSLPGETNVWSHRIEVQLDGFPDTYAITTTPLGATGRASNGHEPSEAIPIVSPFDGDIHVLAVVRAMIAINGVSDPELLARIVVNHFVLNRTGGRFDEALGGFGAMTSTSDRNPSDRLWQAQFRFTIASSSEAKATLASAFCPVSMFGDLSEAISVQPVPETIVANHTMLGFLQKAVDLFAFEGGEMFLRLLKKDVADSREILTYGNFFFHFTLAQGSTISQDALSYGQRRLLSFLYYVACNDDIIIADELVNGMHYEWIEACLAEIGDRQSFLTSQNPLLLDFLTFASVDEVQKSFIQCSREKSEGARAQMRWTNLNREHSESFYRAYEAGVQHVGDILRTKGLW